MRASCETHVLQRDALPVPKRTVRNDLLGPKRLERSEQRLSYLERLAQMVEPVPRAAVLLGISRQRVLQLIQTGDLEAVKIGKDWFVSSLSVQERMNARQKS